mmetsp:Transcript_20029/g.27823  ORF Transcript_20029/g.27823 Transcript_20029/m.27823 type:complete len:81 (-) Transcript_20029:852-1094(-)
MMSHFLYFSSKIDRKAHNIKPSPAIGCARHGLHNKTQKFLSDMSSNDVVEVLIIAIVLSRSKPAEMRFKSAYGRYRDGHP